MSFSLKDVRDFSPLTPRIYCKFRRLDSKSEKNANAATVPAFYRPKGEIDPKNKNNDEIVWSVRYRPATKGTYGAELIMESPPGTFKTVDRRTFRVEKVSAQGFVRAPKVSAPGKNSPAPRFRFDSGEIYFPLGYNICWPASYGNVDDYLQKLDKLKESGGNYTRLWLCTWGFNLETPEAYKLDLKHAEMLDRVFEHAEKLGIRIMLCIDNFHDFNEFADKAPYLNPNGPCEKAEDFFTSDKAFAIYKAKLRYLIARYGSYRSLMCWELWNEVDYTRQTFSQSWSLSDRKLKDKYILPWTERSCREIRRLDAYRHPITTSLGMNTTWPELWNMSEIDIVQMHNYAADDYTRYSPARADSLIFLEKDLSRLKKYGKPTLMSEFGFSGTNERNPLNDRDAKGTMLHNSLWASTFCGWSGTAMHWWWDYHIEKRDLFSHYRALSEFLDKSGMTAQGETFSANSHTLVNLVIMTQNGRTFIWICDKEAGWRKALSKKHRSRLISGVTLNLAGITSEMCEVKFFDTRRGNFISSRTIKPEEGKIVLEVPEFGMDIAALISSDTGKNEK